MVLALLLLAASAPVWEVTQGWSDEHERNYARFIETLLREMATSHGRTCTRCCAIVNEISSSTAWDKTKTTG